MDIMDMKELDKAYIGGIMDGEGSIFLEQQKNRTVNKGYALVPYIVISNTDLRLIEHCKRLIGMGAIMTQKRKKSHWKDAHRLKIWRMDEILKFLDTIEPYLILKRRQSELVREFILSRVRELGGTPHHRNHVRDPKTGRYITIYPTPYTERELEIFEEVKRLNHRPTPEDLEGA